MEMEGVRAKEPLGFMFIPSSLLSPLACFSGSLCKFGAIVVTCMTL